MLYSCPIDSICENCGYTLRAGQAQVREWALPRSMKLVELPAVELF